MNTIKSLRVQSGLTQMTLAEKSGLSLRTIQRLETSEHPPKGNSLAVLSQAFGIEPVALQGQYHSEEEKVESDNHQLDLSIINLGILGFLVFPFGNVFLTYYFWKKKRSVAMVDHAGRRIINFQILWSLLLCASLSVAPFLGSGKSSFPEIFMALIAFILINLVVVVHIANRIRRGDTDFLDLPIRLF